MKKYNWSEIQDLVSRNEEETQILEFKTIFELDDKFQLTKNGKRQLSKHITGMANGAGGTIILGITTKKLNNVDVADEIKPITEVEKYSQLIRGAIAQYSSPQIENIAVDAVHIESPESIGIIVLNIPISNLRPHMATASGENPYYRRGLDGTRLMDNTQIKDMFIAPRHGILNCCPVIRTGTISNYFGFSLNFRLANAGKIMVKNPFLRVTYTQEFENMSPAHHNVRRDDNAVNYQLAKSPYIHIGEVATLAAPKFYMIKENASQKWRLCNRNPNSGGSLKLFNQADFLLEFAAENVSLSETIYSLSVEKCLNAVPEKYRDRL